MTFYNIAVETNSRFSGYIEVGINILFLSVELKTTRLEYGSNCQDQTRSQINRRLAFFIDPPELLPILCVQARVDYVKHLLYKFMQYLFDFCAKLFNKYHFRNTEYQVFFPRASIFRYVGENIKIVKNSIA